MDDAARESGTSEDFAAVPTVPTVPTVPGGSAAPWTGPVEHRTDLRGLLRSATAEPGGARGGTTPSPGEAMALASCAMRLVEAQLVGSGGTGLAAADVSTARAALREARELLDAAAAELPGEPVSAHRRLRSRLRLSRPRPDRR
jgi:hypothetical protein